MGTVTLDYRIDSLVCSSDTVMNVEEVWWLFTVTDIVNDNIMMSKVFGTEFSCTQWLDQMYNMFEAYFPIRFECVEFVKHVGVKI